MAAKWGWRSPIAIKDVRLRPIIQSLERYLIQKDETVTTDVEAINADGWVTTDRIADGAVETPNMADDLPLAVGQDLKSSNYVPGVSGWIIQGDGDAEFQSATMRGELLTGSATDGVRVWFDAAVPENVIEFKKSGDPAEGARLSRSDTADDVSLKLTAPPTTYSPIGFTPSIYVVNQKNSGGDYGITIYPGTAPGGALRVWGKVITGGEQNLDLKPLHVRTRTTNQATVNNTWLAAGLAYPNLVQRNRFDDSFLTDAASYSLGTWTIGQSGLYEIILNTKWESNATGQRASRLLVNGATTVPVGNHQAPPSVLDAPQFTDVHVGTFTAGDTILAQFMQTSGGNLNITGGTFTIKFLSF